MMDKEDKIRLREIRQEMMDLLGEAKNLLRQHGPNDIYTRSKHTWIGHVDAGLGGGDYVDTYDFTFEKALKEMGIDPNVDAEIEEDEEFEEDEDAGESSG